MTFMTFRIWLLRAYVLFGLGKIRVIRVVLSLLALVSASSDSNALAFEVSNILVEISQVKPKIGECRLTFDTRRVTRRYVNRIEDSEENNWDVSRYINEYLANWDVDIELLLANLRILVASELLQVSPRGAESIANRIKSINYSSVVWTILIYRVWFVETVASFAALIMT